jgi:hypothetical protein
MYSIKTEVCGNPDFGQDPRKPPYGVRVKTIKANTFTELKAKVREWIGDNDIGGGNWLEPALLLDGEVIGYMSYNGRVWADCGWTPQTKEITFKELEHED